MGDPLILAGCAVAALSAMAFYMASPHQQCGRLPFSRLVAIRAGCLLLMASIGLMLTWCGWAVALCAPLTVLMLVWSLVPLAMGWWRHRQEGRA